MPSSIKAVGNIERSLSTTNFEFPKPCLFLKARPVAPRRRAGLEGEHRLSKGRVTYILGLQAQSWAILSRRPAAVVARRLSLISPAAGRLVSPRIARARLAPRCHASSVLSETGVA